MRVEERLDTGIIELGSTRCHEPDVMAEELVVAHRGHGIAQIFLRSAVRAGGATLPVIAFEIIPRPDIAARALRIEIIVDAKPVAHARLVLLLAMEELSEAALPAL